MDPPRAIVVCPRLPHPPVTGGQKRTLRLLEAMARAGLRPHLVSADASAPAVAALRRRGWAVEVASPEAVGARLAAVADGAALVQLEHTESAAWAPGRVPAGLPVILSLHNLDSELLRRTAALERPGPARLRALVRARRMRRLERAALPAADRVVCVSARDADAVERTGGRPLLAPNGVDDELFDVPALTGDRERVVFFGALDYEPNRAGLVRFLANGWPAVRARRPQAELAVAGAGLGPDLRGRLDAAPGARALGVVDDLPGLLASARAVVVPLWAGGGTRLKALEALAAARPVVATPIGVEELDLRHGEQAILADGPAGLADGLVDLLEDPARAARMGAAGRIHVDPLRWPRTLATLEADYRARAAAAKRRS